MTISDLKKLFRKVVKVVSGGPADKTRGTGMLAVLDALADELGTLYGSLPQLGRPVQLTDAIIAMDAKSLTAGSDILLGTWNGQPGGVLLPVLGPGTYSPYGIIESGGAIVPVVADVRAGTFYLNGGAGQGRDPYKLTTAKVLQVIADYKTAQGPFVETNQDYYYCAFTDDFTDPGNEFKYECTPSRPVSTGGATVWKWRRYLEAGV